MGKGLRIATLTGLVVVVLYEGANALTSLGGTLHVRGLIACAVISLAVSLALRFLLRDELDTILYRRDILFPLAALTVVEFGLLPLLVVVITPFGASTPLAIGAVTIGLSMSGLLMVAANVLYAVWATFLVVQALDGPVQLDRPTRGVPGRGLVLAALTLIGWCVPILVLGLAIPLAGAGGFGVVLVVIGVFTVVWNLGTSAWLVGAASRGWNLRTALTTGWRAGWAGFRAFGNVVLVQLLLTGVVTFFAVRYTRVDGSTTHTTSRTSWHVNGFWTGGYKHATDWYADYMGVLDHGTLTFVLLVLQLVLGVLALAVRLRVARHVAPVRSPPPEPEKDAVSSIEPPVAPGIDYDEY